MQLDAPWTPIYQAQSRTGALQVHLEVQLDSLCFSKCRLDPRAGGTGPPKGDLQVQLDSPWTFICQVQLRTGALQVPLQVQLDCLAVLQVPSQVQLDSPWAPI